MEILSGVTPSVVATKVTNWRDEIEKLPAEPPPPALIDRVPTADDARRARELVAKLGLKQRPGSKR